MDRQALKTRLVSFVGEAKPLAERISSISDMEELIRFWRENPRDQAIIEARMAAVINALPVDNIDELPAWFMTIVGDEMLLPLTMLRIFFREKAREINSRL